MTNSGAVFAPGETGSRTLHIAGTYTQQAGGALDFDLGGDAASGDFDRFAVTGAALSVAWDHSPTTVSARLQPNWKLTTELS
jgi:hypothetical protein